MKLHPILLASVAFPLFAGAALADAPLSADRCRPLTEWNVRECCSAPNWRDIILPGQQAICRHGEGHLADEDDDSVGSITRPGADNGNPPRGDDDGDDDNGSGNGPPDLGNPGNSEDVGRAGEKNMANEGADHNDYGTRGNSNEPVGNPSGGDHGPGRDP